MLTKCAMPSMFYEMHIKAFSLIYYRLSSASECHSILSCTELWSTNLC